MYNNLPFPSNNIDVVLNASNITFDEPVICSSNLTNLGSESISGNFFVGGSNIVLANNPNYPSTISFGNAYQPTTYLFYSPVSATFSQIYNPGLTYLAGSVVMSSTVLMAGSNQFTWSSNAILYCSPASNNYIALRMRNTDPLNVNSRFSVGNIAASNFYASEIHGYALGTVETTPAKYLEL